MDMDLDNGMIEAFARVVSLDGATAWLEPEPKTSCGSCTSLACGAETLSSRIVARRFSLANDENFVIGDRVVVGIRSWALLKAALTAYTIPVMTTLGAGILAQWLMNSDGVTLAATVLGLVFGLGVAHVVAIRLAHQKEMAPYFIRRAEPCRSHAFSGH